MELIAYWTYALIITLLSIAPGMALALKLKGLTTLERLAASFGLSFLALLILIPFFALKFYLAGRFLFLVITLSSLFYLSKHRREIKLDRDTQFILLVLLLGIASKLFLQTLWDYPVLGGDWFLHAFEVPYRFETGDWTPHQDKTPLFHLLVYSYHHLLGTSLYDFWVSQIISLVINSAFILPAYLIAKKAFGDWVAKTSVLFILINSFLTVHTMYTSPKNAAMYGILAMIYFLFFSKQDTRSRYSIAGIFAGIAFLFHNYAIFYIGIAVLLFMYREKMHRQAFRKAIAGLRQLFPFMLVLLVFILPYFIWVNLAYGTFVSSGTIYYPFAVNGYPDALFGNKEELFKTFYSTPPHVILFIRIINVMTTFTPATIPLNPYFIGYPGYHPLFYFALTYPGVLSLLMYLLTVLWFVRYSLGKERTDPAIAGFFLMTSAVIIVLYGWKDWGFVPGILHPMVPLLIMLGFNELHNLGSRIRRALTYLIFISAAAEDAIYSKIILDFSHLEGGLQGLMKISTSIPPGFQAQNFVSAHFLFDTTGVMANLLISLSLTAVAAYQIHRIYYRRQHFLPE